MQIEVYNISEIPQICSFSNIHNAKIYYIRVNCMKKYTEMTKEELEREKKLTEAEYLDIKAKNYSLDMSRGKPSNDQLGLTESLLHILNKGADCKTEDGIDCRNYGQLFGLKEARVLFSDLLGIPADNIILGGNSSLNMMYDTVARAMLYGVPGSDKPWCKQEHIKFLCPSPGYDRHFHICESLGIEMIPVDMTPDGPDMDTVERLVSEDESIKGIWCVPKYSNPQGITYSDETVKRFARLDCKAKDFRIFWDNAYAVHDLDDHGDKLLNIFSLMHGTKYEDQLYYFFSTSKISFPGSGVALLALSDRNLAATTKIIEAATIGPDKINQLRHVRYFTNAEGIIDHMRLHGMVLKPKFDVVLDTLEKELKPTGIADWTRPKGGYFISLDVADDTAKETYRLASEAGVKITKAGATFPYGKDPRDRNLRLAPSYPPLDELAAAIHVICVCAKLAYLNKIS